MSLALIAGKHAEAVRARCVVIATERAVRVASKADLHNVKALVHRLREKGWWRREHPRVYRPCGFYQKIDTGPRFRVERIVVDPGKTCPSR